MSFIPEDLAIDPVSRVRFEVGDTSQYPIFSDSVYDYIIIKNDGDEYVSAMEVLEKIITSLIISPSEFKVGNITDTESYVVFFEGRLEALRQTQYRKAGQLSTTPLAVRSDRKNWDDLNSIFKRSGS